MKNYYINNEELTDAVIDFNNRNVPIRYYNDIYELYVKEIDSKPMYCEKWTMILNNYYDYRIGVIEKSINKKVYNAEQRNSSLFNIDEYRIKRIDELNERLSITKTINPSEGLKATLTPSNYIGESILKIATKLASNFRYYMYTWKEDMIYDGVEQTLRYMHNFSPIDGGNAFNYFTQTISQSFLRFIAKENNQLDIKLKMLSEYNNEINYNFNNYRDKGEYNEL